MKTVVITHPDSDHYGWLTKLFYHAEDHIDYLIFGGLPEAYDISGRLQFKEWIVDRLAKNSKIFFPAIQYEAITSFDDVLPHEGRTYALHQYATSNTDIEEFKEAFDFGKEVNICPLSVNPTHIVGKSGTIRMSEPEDDNRDSLALKIAHGKASAILTGDATGVTTTRIIDNYSDDKDFLKTNVLLASHHGSATHDSNNEGWIKITSPEYIIVSNGHSLGHPHETAYDNFKKSERLKKVLKHKILTGRNVEEKPLGKFEEGILHETQRAIFSTLSSGTITIKLNEDGKVELNAEIGPQIKELTSKSLPEDKRKNVIMRDKESQLLISPSPMHPQIERKKVESPIPLMFSPMRPKKAETPQQTELLLEKTSNLKPRQLILQQ